MPPIPVIALAVVMKFFVTAAIFMCGQATARRSRFSKPAQPSGLRRGPFAL
jgi:hypothetical protein